MMQNGSDSPNTSALRSPLASMTVDNMNTIQTATFEFQLPNDSIFAAEYLGDEIQHFK